MNMVDVKLAQESADIVWCNWDISRLRGSSSESSGKLCSVWHLLILIVTELR